MKTDNKKGVLYWITGLSGSGKTTIGNRLYYEIKKTRDDVILLDGDALKKVMSDDDGEDPYTDSARRKRAQKYAKMCKLLADQGFVVICCTIAMYESVREWNRKNNKRYVEVYLDVPFSVLEERNQKGLYSKNKEGKVNNLAGVDLKVEYPQHPDITLVNDGRYSVKECVDKILEVNIGESSDFDRDTDYWNSYYSTVTNISKPSLFAEYVLKYMNKGKSLLELGCGNGRDSIYFAYNGINVTAIDASNGVIEELRSKEYDGNIYFICDDFVTAPALFTGQYDYCYSRFSLHAINASQEKEVIDNVFNVLKNEGVFFVEVRSINDELYGKGEMVDKDAFFYQGHYRRFIRIDELVERMKNVGFEILYAKEDIDFAPFDGSNPPIIRVIAKKMGG